MVAGRIMTGGTKRPPAPLQILETGLAFEAYYYYKRSDLIFRRLVCLAAVAVAVAAATPTYHKDVERIVQNRCQGCHRPGEAAPMALLTYQEVRPWAKAIRTSVASGKMPPWQADPHYGKFTNDLSLAPGERETLLAWVDSGAPEGDPADAPRPRAFVDGWRIPKPDVVFELPEEV